MKLNLCNPNYLMSLIDPIVESPNKKIKDWTIVK